MCTGALAAVVVAKAHVIPAVQMLLQRRVYPLLSRTLRMVHGLTLASLAMDAAMARTATMVILARCKTKRTVHRKSLLQFHSDPEACYIVCRHAWASREDVFAAPPPSTCALIQSGTPSSTAVSHSNRDSDDESRCSCRLTQLNVRSTTGSNMHDLGRFLRWHRPVLPIGKCFLHRQLK